MWLVHRIFICKSVFIKQKKTIGAEKMLGHVHLTGNENVYNFI